MSLVSTTTASSTKASAGTDILPPKFSGSKAADFLALLAGSTSLANSSTFSANSSGGNVASLAQRDTPAPQNTRNTSSSKHSNNEQNTNDIQTHDSDAPSPLAIPGVPQAVHKLLEKTVSTPVKKAANDKSDPIQNDSNFSTSNTTDSSQATTGVATAQPQAASEPVATAGQTDSTLPSPKQLRASLGDELSRLEQILSSVIQLLASSAAASGAVADANKNVVATSAPITDPLMAGLTARQIVPQQDDKSGLNLPLPTNTLSTNELGLLQDMQSVLGQLQQALQGNSSPIISTTLPLQQAPDILQVDAPQNDLGQLQQVLQDNSNPIISTTLPLQQAPDILQVDAPQNDLPQSDLLQAALTKLTQLVGQQVPSAPTATVAAPPALATIADTASTSATTIPTDGIVSIIKSSIADVRRQLQKLSTENEAIFSQATNSGKTSLIDPISLFKDALSVNGLTIKDNGSQAAITYSGTVATQTQDSTASQTATNTQSDILFTAGAAVAQQASNNSNNSDSENNNHGQSQSPIITQTAAAQAQPGTGVNGASFSRLLEQPQAPQPVREQIAFQVKTALSDGSSKITIQLHPGDLGKLDIKLNVDADGKTSVIVTADSRHTLDLLQRDAQGLSRALSDAGLKTDSGSISFNLGGGQNQNSGQGSNAQSLTTYQKMQPEEEQDPGLAFVSGSYVMSVTEGLDIQI